MFIGLPWWLSSKNLPAKAGDAGSVPGLGRSPGEGNGNSLQYSCLANPMDGRTQVDYNPWGLTKVKLDLVTNQQLCLWLERLSFLKMSYVQAQSLSHVQLLWDPTDCSPPRFFCPWDLPDKNTGVCCHFPLQGIFLTQGSNLPLLHWQADFFTTVPPGKPLRCWFSPRWISRLNTILV